MRNALILLVFLSAIAYADYAAGLRAYQSGDYASAFAQWQPLAMQGDAKSQFQVGNLYQTGRTVRQDYEQAAIWYRRSADQGYAAAQNNLGSLYQFGRGVTQSYDEAVKWYQKAADQGLAVAQNNLGYCHLRAHGIPQDYVKAEMWFALAGPGTDQQDADARVEAAKMLTPDQMAQALRAAQEWRTNFASTRAMVPTTAPAQTIVADKETGWRVGKVLDSKSVKTYRQTSSTTTTGGTAIGSDGMTNISLASNTRIQGIVVQDTELLVLGKEYGYVVTDSVVTSTSGSNGRAGDFIISSISRALASRKHGCRFVIGDNVKYVQDKSTLNVLDADGKQCSMAIVRQERIVLPEDRKK